MPNDIQENNLAEAFADHFMNKIDIIREFLRDFDDYKAEIIDAPLFENFQELSEDEVKALISQLQTKTCELDVLPTNVLKSHLNDIVLLFTK